MNILYSLQHLGYVITTFMTWNLLLPARKLRDTGGIPAHGNQRAAWAAGCRFDFVNPDYR